MHKCKVNWHQVCSTIGYKRHCLLTPKEEKVFPLLFHTWLFRLVAMLKCCGVWRLVHRLWQSWFISRLIISLFVFINLEPIWAYRQMWGVEEHRTQGPAQRACFTLWNYWSDTQRSLNHQTADNLTFPVSSALFLASTHFIKCDVTCGQIWYTYSELVLCI